MSEAELALSRRMLAQFAEQEGYALGTVYVERIEQAPAAFEALVASAIRDEARAVIVPNASHLWLIGAAADIASRVAARTGALVLEARHVAPDALDGPRKPPGEPERGSQGVLRPPMAPPSPPPDPLRPGP
ncbi:hypothetical protein [Nocardioides speluncae]|uniref:hypothetical protein n=1 Tax=Nocardioides speluncae TaxID=2670337 RepID=UPI0012B16C78|nr:hypothetical protein [Nocardioides speluncae]